ncbi:MAG: amino acid ABC transporter ATP-binding protein, partial [Clostridia bacterium]|nr:amino acid ABC transporter ATP-binding protein [Clostridia bacterium]
MIEVRGLTKRFGKLTVLDNISTDFAQGEVVSIIGPSGGGKSTFLRCLNLLETPSEGQIFFDGVDICDKKTDINLHRQKMGMVFQQFNLFENMNVMRNMTAAPVKIKKMPQAEAEEKARGLLTRVGLLVKALAYPSQLCGRQKQRLAFVRALMMDPEVMLFEETRSALDPEM